MGTVEVMDQVTGVQWGIDNGLVQPDQVGVFGWSYGGYASLICLCYCVAAVLLLMCCCRCCCFLLSALLLLLPLVCEVLS